MREIVGNIWNHHYPESDTFTGITTNGFIKNDGCAVMGRGIAQQAAAMYPELPQQLGGLIKLGGNNVFALSHNLVSIPVKHNWFDKADMTLIEKSLKQLIIIADALSPDFIFMPRPGCGNGQLDWKDVKPLCASLLDMRFVIVEWRR